MELIKWMMHLIAQHKCAHSHTLIHMRGFQLNAALQCSSNTWCCCCCLLPHTIHNTRTTFSRNKPNRYSTQRKTTTKCATCNTIFLLTPQIDVSIQWQNFSIWTETNFDDFPLCDMILAAIFHLRDMTFHSFLGSQPMLTKHKTCSTRDKSERKISAHKRISVSPERKFWSNKKNDNKCTGMVTFHFFFRFFSLFTKIHTQHSYWIMVYDTHLHCGIKILRIYFEKKKWIWNFKLVFGVTKEFWKK